MTAAVLAVAVGVVSAVPFYVGTSRETFGGTAVPAEFLTHWQFVGSAPGVTPRPVPAAWSAIVGAPTRLGAVSASARIDAARVGDTGAVWTINETAGIAPSTELELSFSITYVAGTVTRAVALTVYVETYVGAIAGTLTFTVRWDSGTREAITLQSQLLLTQVCSGVGVCP